jgi:glc operon protein GlcG
MRTKIHALVMLLSAGPMVSVAVAEPPTKLPSKPLLSMALAQKMAMACVSHQRASNGLPVDIAIYDDGAKLIYFVSMDGTSIGTGTTAMAKAESAARFRYSSAETGSWVKGNPAVGHVPGLLGVRGGLPIFTASGKPLGGIGVSGSPAEVDEKCAQAAIDAVAPELHE